MHMYNKSEELVKELEVAVQEERNDSRKTQYQILLQQQRNASATLKSLGEANTDPRQLEQQAQQQKAQQQQAGAYTTEFAGESNFNTANMKNAQASNQQSEANARKKADDTNK